MTLVRVLNKRTGTEIVGLTKDCLDEQVTEYLKDLAKKLDSGCECPIEDVEVEITYTVFMRDGPPAASLI